MNEDLETIADEISNLVEQIDMLMSQYNVPAVPEEHVKLTAARQYLIAAEDSVRFLL